VLQRVIPVVQGIVSNPVIQGVTRLVNGNSQALYSVAIDYIAYRIAWHMYVLEHQHDRQPRRRVGRYS